MYLKWKFKNIVTKITKIYTKRGVCFTQELVWIVLQDVMGAVVVVIVW